MSFKVSLSSYKQLKFASNKMRRVNKVRFPSFSLHHFVSFVKSCLSS